jgi:hypothetical protein
MRARTQQGEIIKQKKRENKPKGKITLFLLSPRAREGKLYQKNL